MDVEEREAFKDIREAVDRGYGRLEAKVDQARSEFNEHVVEAAKESQRLADSVSAAHRRLDTHETWHKDHKDHGMRKVGLWVTAIIGAVGAIIAAIKAFGGKGGGS